MAKLALILAWKLLLYWCFATRCLARREESAGLLNWDWDNMRTGNDNKKMSSKTCNHNKSKNVT